MYVSYASSNWCKIKWKTIADLRFRIPARHPILKDHFQDEEPRIDLKHGELHFCLRSLFKLKNLIYSKQNRSWPISMWHLYITALKGISAEPQSRNMTKLRRSAWTTCSCQTQSNLKRPNSQPTLIFLYSPLRSGRPWSSQYEWCWKYRRSSMAYDTNPSIRVLKRLLLGADTLTAMSPRKLFATVFGGQSALSFRFEFSRLPVVG